VIHTFINKYIKRYIISVILFLSTLFTFSACSSDSSKSGEIPAIEGYSSEALAELSKYGKISLLEETDFDKIDSAKYKVAYVEVSQKERTNIVSNLQKFFNKSEYQVFYTSMSIDNTPEKVCKIVVLENKSIRYFEFVSTAWSVPLREALLFCV
jgi:hypothetical protein